MRRVLIFVCVVCINTPAFADPPERYIGVVRREGTGTPVPNVPISANVDPAPSLAFWLPRGPETIAGTRTDARGRFGFRLAAPRRRLWFIAYGMPTLVRTGPLDPTGPRNYNMILGDRVIRQPQPNTLNVIEVPKTFRPRTKSIHDLTNSPKAIQDLTSKPR